MALTNFTLPFGGISHHWSATTIGPASLQQYHASAVNNLLYDPADHQESDDPPEYFKNNPYAPPQNHHQYNSNNNNNNNGRLRNSKSYLPPLPSSQASTQRHNSHYQAQHHATNVEQKDQQLGYNTRTRNNNNNNHEHNIQYNNHQQNHQQSVQIPKGNYLPAHQQSPQLSLQQPTSQQQHEDTSNSYIDGDNDTIYDNNNNNHDHQYQHQQYLPPSSSSSSLPSSPTSSASHNNQGQYFNGYNTYTRTYSSHNIGVTQPTLSIPTNQQLPTYSNNNHNRNNYNTNNNSGPNRGDSVSGYKTKTNNQGTSPSVSSSPSSIPSGSSGTSDVDNNDDDSFPERPPGFTRVQAGQGSRTQVHAVLDYDIDEGDEEYYDDTDNDGKKSSMPTVTPIQGPIFLKNGTVPVVPLFSYPTVNNGTFVQIPIWWTALSVALGLDIRGDVIRGVPCIKRYHQLFCPTAGNSYPIEKIEKFIDDNKALMRRMYGDFEMTDYGTPLGQSRRRRRRYIDDPDIFVPPGAFPADAFESEPDTETGETYFGKLRKKRQSSGNRNKNNQKPGSNNRGGGNIGRGSNAPNSNTDSGSGKVDVCESKVEVVTPYWASNSAGKIRAIVNTQHFEQAIHQEMCTKVTTARCGNDCGCEQKYKWHRLLAYDPDNDCKGIFMDWFLFPSCCVCRCSP